MADELHLEEGEVAVRIVLENQDSGYTFPPIRMLEDGTLIFKLRRSGPYKPIIIKQVGPGILTA